MKSLKSAMNIKLAVLLLAVIAAAFCFGMNTEESYAIQGTTEDGFTYTDGQGFLEPGYTGVCIYKYTGDAENIVVPSEIQGVPVVQVGYDTGGMGGKVFSDDRANLKSIVFPDSVKVIRDNTLWSCNKCSSITLPEHLEILGDGALGYTAIESIELPSTLTRIDKNMNSALTSSA